MPTVIDIVSLHSRALEMPFGISRWPGAAGWRPRGGGAACPAWGVARQPPAASGATIWPLYA